MKRTLSAAVAVVILILTGLSVYPRMQPGYALAQSALAMSKIESAHVIGFAVGRSGERKKLEMWVKGDRMRISCDGVYEESLDGKLSIQVTLGEPEPEALVQPAENVEPDITLSMFHGPTAVDKAVKNNGAEFAGTRRIHLPNGMPALVTEVQGCHKRWLVYMDPETDLIIRWESYYDGRLEEAIETFMYNVPVPDSVFTLTIPKGIPVLDLVTPPSPEKREWRLKQGQRLDQQCAQVAISISSGEDRSRFHPDFSFKCLSSGGLKVYYLPNEDVYWVLGKARITGPNGFSEVMEDRAIKLPGKADNREALMEKGKRGEFCNAEKTEIWQFEPIRFVNAGAGPLTVRWDKTREIFTIEGKARLLPLGNVYADQTIDLKSWDIIDQLERLEKPVWTGLPDHEAVVAREELDNLQRSRRLVKTDDKTGDNYINGAKVEFEGNGLGGMRRGHFSSGYGLTIEPAGSALPYIYIVPSQQKYYVVGTAKVKVKGLPDRMVKNGIVSFGGEVLSGKE